MLDSNNYDSSCFVYIRRSRMYFIHGTIRMKGFFVFSIKLVIRLWFFFLQNTTFKEFIKLNHASNKTLLIFHFFILGTFKEYMIYLIRWYFGCVFQFLSVGCIIFLYSTYKNTQVFMLIHRSWYVENIFLFI